MLEKNTSLVRLLIFLSAISLSCGLLADQASASFDSSCLTCHAKFKKTSRNDHPALGIGCNACHVAAADKAHPQQKDGIKLKQEVPGLCYGCHKKARFQETNIHPPVAEGKCTTCHNPHTSAFSSLLQCDPPELCYGCHDKSSYTKKYLHPVIIGRQCNCHNPHASNYPSLLASTVNEGCIGCHRDKKSGSHIVALPKGKIHPIDGTGPGMRNIRKQISCATCHNPHSSNYRKLFPKARVCRICHKYF